MKPNRVLPLCCALLMAMGSAGSARAQDQAAEEEIPEYYRAFTTEAQKRVADFPLIPVGTTAGKHEIFAVRIDEKPVVIGEHRFGCVRFVTPPETPRDMVWAFSVPAEWAQWYILPATGSMTGFRNWLDADRLYEGLPATVDNAARLQTLAAASFKPGATYVLWFKAQSATPGAATLTGAVNFLPPLDEGKEWDIEAIEKAMGLKAASAAEQVAYLKSRGGRALLDPRYFRPEYAKGRIDDLLFARRRSHRFASGLFIEMRISIPPCETEPALADVQAAYGDADLVLSGKERRLFDKEAPADQTACYYDRVAFLVREKRGQSRILNVTTQAPDASAIRPRQDGLTWGDSPMPEIKLRVFYRDRKEIARVAFWGEAGAQLLSGELPADTFRVESHNGELREELEHLGKGRWNYRSTYKDGQPSRIAAFEDHAYHGVLRDFYPNGKPQAEANYTQGQLDGILKQWRPSGESRELRYRAGELVREGADKPR